MKAAYRQQQYYNHKTEWLMVWKVFDKSIKTAFVAFPLLRFWWNQWSKQQLVPLSGLDENQIGTQKVDYDTRDKPRSLKKVRELRYACNCQSQPDPDLYRGVTFVTFHSLGTSPVSRDKLMRNVNGVVKPRQRLWLSSLGGNYPIHRLSSVSDLLAL